MDIDAGQSSLQQAKSNKNEGRDAMRMGAENKNQNLRKGFYEVIKYGSANMLRRRIKFPCRLGTSS